MYVCMHVCASVSTIFVCVCARVHYILVCVCVCPLYFSVCVCVCVCTLYVCVCVCVCVHYICVCVCACDFYSSDHFLLSDNTTILRPKESLWPGRHKVFMVIQDQQGKACDNDQVLNLEVCSCTKDNKCPPQLDRRPSATLGPA